MPLSILNLAKERLLQGDFCMASSYYERARQEGVANCVVNLRYLTKEYLVYPLEYENSANYFELIKMLRRTAMESPEYESEYRLAAQSLYDIRRLFMRSLSLFYYSDILVSSRDSIVLQQITEIHRYIKVNKQSLLNDDIFELQRFVPNYNRTKFAQDLNIIEAYCMNILLSYTAEQHSVYQGKRYNAQTVDYGYYYCTTIRESDRYYNYANIKPRLFLLGYEAYYFDILAVYKEKLKEIGGMDCPKNLKKELTYYVRHKDKKDQSAKEFLTYAKQFEKQDYSRFSVWGSLTSLGKKINPLLRLNPTDKLLENNVGSFELDEYFPQKKFLGVCSMLAAANHWKVDTVRVAILILSYLGGIGVMAYFAFAIAKKCGFYFGINVQKP